MLAFSLFAIPASFLTFANGKADREKGIDNTLNTRFRIGSMNKNVHGGRDASMNAILRVYPESGQSVIVLCNLDSPSASRIGDWLHARMPLE